MTPVLPDIYSPEEKEEIERRHRELIDAWQTRKETQDLEAVEKAFYFACEAHKDQRRRSGEPYIYHPIAVAHIAAHDIGLGRTSIICALLHDVVEDTQYTLDDITEMFGEKVSRVVDGLTKFDKMEGAESMQAENFKKIISSLSYDVRVVLIKLSDRLHNMRTLDSMPKHKQLKIASETSYIYAPLAYRLGLHAIKIELEDLALKYTNPTIYENIRKRKDEVREQRLHELHDFITPVMAELEKAGIKARAEIKERSVNSVWKRMMDKELPFEELYGSFIVRFIADCPKETERLECWKVYALLTNCYRPNTAKLKDWISLPKSNGYESLHAVVMGKTGNWVEVQIRSQRMEEIAEKGFAAYWKYKTDDETESGFDEWLKKAQDLIGNGGDNAIEFVDNFKLDLFADEIFVFTPKGKMIPLPKGSTVLDFAYNIHSEIGDHSIAANVNSQLDQLDRVLRTGDRVEVITSESQHPQEKWFEFLATATAKSRLKSGIKEYRRTFREAGEKKYEEIMRKLDLEASKANRNVVMANEKLTSSVDFYYLVATGKIDERIIREVLKPQSGSNSFVRYITFGLLGGNSKTKVEEASISSSGEFDFNVSSCCNPIPGDDVIAFSFPSEPLQIHRSDCPRAIQLSARHGNNIVKAKWQPKSEIAFLSELKITALDTAGLLNRMTNLLSNEMKLNMHSLHMESKKDLVEATLSIYVHNTKELDDLITKLNRLKDVQKVIRKTTAEGK
ncbi:MAG: bifunctional (p)ppGpp synthetase/guanosine-3',5'-bis(diphosphate) 3'-pyrophosphohydrolase [Bacteroidales bacterium]|nr:bifunctional (p)ppGpp synthetase/guanosine-3',5'-bis(diphosphate) 3'-pyrophosphohydrolase [Bacteroidales bacterium]